MAVGEGVQLVGADLFAVFFDQFGAVFGDCDVDFCGMSGLEAADFPAGVDEAVHDIGLELVLRLEKIVVETSEDLEDFLGLGFEDDPGRKHSMSRAVEGGAGFAGWGGRSVTFAAVLARLFGSGEGHRVFPLV